MSKKLGKYLTKGHIWGELSGTPVTNTRRLRTYRKTKLTSLQ